MAAPYLFILILYTWFSCIKRFDNLANVGLSVFSSPMYQEIVGIYHSTILAFLEPHDHHTASNHPMISKLYHFYLQHLPSQKV